MKKDKYGDPDPDPVVVVPLSLLCLPPANLDDLSCLCRAVLDLRPHLERDHPVLTSLLLLCGDYVTLCADLVSGSAGLDLLCRAAEVIIDYFVGKIKNGNETSLLGIHCDCLFKFDPTILRTSRKLLYNYIIINNND